MTGLRRMVVRGFRSIKDVDLELRSLNVLIGANGAGKSNLVSFFKLLNEMMGGRLQIHVAETGRAHSLLHNGPKQTPQMEAFLEFENEQGVNEYHQRLFHVAGDALAFAEETLSFKRRGHEALPGTVVDLGSGHEESRIKAKADEGDKTAAVFRWFLNLCRVYHFHDTSPTARARNYCDVSRNLWLAPDAGNVAAMLKRFRDEENPAAYRRILSAVRQIAPFLADFALEPTAPNNSMITLNWLAHDSGEVFAAHQLSDGTLRFIALATLLLQPPNLPLRVVVIDEPELGLHPAALNLLAGMIRSASTHCQVIVSTQSAALLDAFDPEDVVVVNRRDGGSVFERLSDERLATWLEDYTLGQLWEKNVIEGGPFA